MWPKHLKNFCFWLILLGVAIVLEYTRRVWNIPVALGDLLLLPCSALTIYLCGYQLLSHVAGTVEPEFRGSHWLGASSFLWIALGIVVFYMGINDPLGHFSGAKGAAHGYSLLASGFGIFLLGVSVLVAWLYKLLGNR